MRFNPFLCVLFAVFFPLISCTASADEAKAPLPIELPEAFFGGTPLCWGEELEKEFDTVRPPFLAPIGTMLISKGKTVTASATPIEGELNQITDGKKEYSQTVLGKIRSPALVELPEGLQWIQIDLAQPKAIHAVVVWHHLQRQVCFDVVACLSDDPDFKSGVCTIYNNDTDNSANLGLGEDKEYIESNKGLLIDAEGKSARFLRIYGNGNTYNGFTPFVEVEVWGK